MQHQEVILWLREMNAEFQFCQETYALAVCVLNRLLATVKVSISSVNLMWSSSIEPLPLSTDYLHASLSGYCCRLSQSTWSVLPSQHLFLQQKSMKRMRYWLPFAYIHFLAITDTAKQYCIYSVDICMLFNANTIQCASFILIVLVLERNCKTWS